MPDSSPSWRSTFIQALVVLLVLALAALKAVSTETIAGALMMVVTAIFMGQREGRALAAVHNAAVTAGASNPRMAAVRAPGPNERVGVEVTETREMVGPRRAERSERGSVPGELPRAAPGRYPTGGGGGYGGGTGDLGGDDRRVALAPGVDAAGGGVPGFAFLAGRMDTFALVLIAVFFATCAVVTVAKAATAGMLLP